MHSGKINEKRRAARTRRSEALFWRRPWQREFAMGWTLEASDDGVAFAWRGAVAPPPGRLIEVQRHVARPDDPPEVAVVRRTTHAHDDLVIIAAEFLSPGDGENDAEAHAATAEVVVKRGVRSRAAKTDPLISTLDAWPLGPEQPAISTLRQT